MNVISWAKFFTQFLPRDGTQSAALLWQVVRPRLSVCPSVTLRYREHIGWNSPKITIISRLVNMGCSLSTDPNFADLYDRREKWILAYKSSNISEMRQDSTNVTIEDQ